MESLASTSHTEAHFGIKNDLTVTGGLNGQSGQTDSSDSETLSSSDESEERV